MFKLAFVLCLACFVVIEGRPKWQYLPPVPGYVPVYIQSGDTPLDLIHPELAAAFHAVYEGRSASKQIEASSDEQPEPIIVEPADQVVPEEAAAEAEEPAVKEELAAKAEEPVVKAEEPAIKTEELAVKAEDPSVKAENEPEEHSADVETKKLKETPEEFIDRRPYAKKVLEKKKVSSEVAKPERR